MKYENWKFYFREAALISEITQWIMESMRTYGQLSVFIGVIVEQIIIPVPSPLIIMGAGALLIPPGISIPNAFLQILWTIVLPGSIASTLGSYIGYMISFYGGKAVVVRLQRFLDVDWDQIERLEKRFQGREEALSIFLPSYSCLPHLSGFYFCRSTAHSDQTLYDLYLFGFDLPMFFSGFFWMVDRSHLRKSSHPLRFGGDDRLYRDVDRDGCGFRIPLL